ncbi:TIGR01244 family phosphatase [Aquicoccus sp. SCR17]|nr:TIGR01244 family phosphatase [Carideicomes alvinocaridis]
MDIRQITPVYHVSEQITPEEVRSLPALGFTRVICNRPDAEVGPGLLCDEVAAAAREAGLDFAALPLTNQTMTPDNIARQAELIAESDGKVLAYCRSGTRCSVVWALSQAGTMPVDEILTHTANAGYQLEELRPTLEALANR